MPYWICYYHVIWATKYRAELITPPYAQIIYEAIRAKAGDLGGEALAVNGMPDHVHVAAAIPPAIAIAKWVGEIKGASSRAVNTAFPDDSARFRWQGSYGVLTVGSRQLNQVIDYITRQQEHHAQGTTNAHLERVDDEH
ncbi:MAG: IS200/IS605 family transposase [Anaerolineae bacterium]|nr:IS200/IS605 family transposase [Anaerolineae bacterium]